METSRRNFVGATLGLIGGIAFKIPVPPKYDPKSVAIPHVDNESKGYKGVVHTSIGDITVPINRIVEHNGAVTYFCDEITDIKMSLIAYAITLLNPSNKIIGKRKKFHRNVCMVVGDTLRVSTTFYLTFLEDK